MRMVSWRGYSKRKLNSFNCSQMKPMVRMETSRTLRSSELMLAVIFSAIPGHSLRGISMQQTAATIWVGDGVRWQLLSV